MKHDISDILKKAKLKNTPARQAILKVFFDHHEPINAEDIFKLVKAKDINQVTVYRNLSSLEEVDVIKQVDLRKNSVYYELADSHHHHLVCTQCGMTEDFEVCDIDAVTKKVLKNSAKFASVEQHALELFGLCKVCAEE